MKNTKKILTIVFGIVMILGGIVHLINPVMYAPFIPAFLPVNAVIYASGILEIAIGIGTFIPKYRQVSTLLILILMIAFLPLHAIDVFSEKPTIGSHQIAIVRLPMQFVLIAWAWYINKREISKVQILEN